MRARVRVWVRLFGTCPGTGTGARYGCLVRVMVRRSMRGAHGRTHWSTVM